MLERWQEEGSEWIRNILKEDYDGRWLKPEWSWEENKI